jgi:FKBP-type peptidyl-prolyl cis-trans isomerase
MQRSGKASDEAVDISGGNGGLLKKIITAGTGERIPANVVAIVHYTGKLLDGTVFDSSKKRGTPFNFNLGKREGRIMIVNIFHMQ